MAHSSKITNHGILPSFRDVVPLIPILLAFLTSVSCQDFLSRERRNAAIHRSWTEGTIPFYYDPAFPESQRETVRSGMDFWERRTCVTFKENMENRTDKVRIVNGSGCFSKDGKRSDEKTVLISADCNGMSTVTHELAHLLGLEHSHQRADRDDYVTVVDSNIPPEAMFNFEKLDSENYTDYGLPYDYGSIMHYDYNTMAIDPSKPSLISKDVLYHKSMGNFLPSFYDVIMVNRLYNCTDRCDGVKVHCQNGGVQDVRDCTKCLCPTGYGGLYCGAQPDGCYNVVNTTESPEVLTIEIGSEEKADTMQFDQCLYLIKADEGKKVEVTVKDVYGIQSESCEWAGLELLSRNDTTFAGPRICKLSDAEESYRSEGRHFFLKIYNRSSVSRFKIEHRAVD